MEISEIDLAKSRPYKDFGKAFYLSSDKQQALSMARFKALTVGGEEKITTFDFDENNTSALRIKKFDNYRQGKLRLASFSLTKLFCKQIR